MSWFARILAVFKPTEPEDELDDTPPAPSHINWPAFESGLLALLEQELADFATHHPHETFYSVALDCNARYRDVLLSANTPQALERLSREYAEDKSAAAIARSADAMRFGFGDWEYQGVNIDSPAWAEQYYERLMDGVEEIGLPEDIEQFMVSACRVLLRLEKSEAMLALSRTADFRVACADQVESIAAGDARLARIRAEMASAQGGEPAATA